MANNSNRKMTREEAGRLGGEATAKSTAANSIRKSAKRRQSDVQNHSREFYQEIGQKGGEATSRNHNREFYQGNWPQRRQK